MAAVGLLGISNVVSNRHLPERAHVPWNLALATGLVGLARRAGCDAADLGLDGGHLRGGLRTGAGAAAVVAAAYGAALASGPDRASLRDRRAVEPTTGAAAYQLAVRIPLGTVLAEEVAFRGVLPALLASPSRPRWAPAAVSSLLFGLWHLLPSRDLLAVNDGARALADRTGPTAATGVAVVATAVAGAALQVLRRRGRHLAGPALAHLAANELGFAVARRAGRLEMLR